MGNKAFGTMIGILLCVIVVAGIALWFSMGSTTMMNTRPEPAPSADHNMFSISISSVDELDEDQKEDVEWALEQDGEAAENYEIRADGWATITEAKAVFVGAQSSLYLVIGLVIFLFLIGAVVLYAVVGSQSRKHGY